MGSAPEVPDLLPGTLELLILKILAPGEQHGYNIAQRLKAMSEAGGSDAAVAGRALRRLFALARQAEAGV